MKKKIRINRVKSKPTEYFHIGSSSLKPGDDLMSLSDQHGKEEAYRKFKRRYPHAGESSGESESVIKRIIHKHTSHVHIVGHDYYGIDHKTGNPPKNIMLGDKSRALYKITPDQNFHKTTKRFGGDSIDHGDEDHYLTPRVPARLISHKWNEKDQKWNLFNKQEDNMKKKIIVRKKIKEETAANSVSAGGIAGITGDPPVGRKTQKRWIRKNSIFRRPKPII